MTADARRRAARPAALVLAALVLAMFLIGPRPGAAAAPSVVLQAPARAFGYFIGDTMRATAIVSADPDAVFEMTSLPAEGPISTWIDLRRIAVSQQRAGKALQFVLHLEYQSFFDPEEASSGTIPGFEVALLLHGSRLSVHIPGFSFLASPFRHVLQPVIESSALQPDHPFLTLPVRGLQLRLLAASAVAVAAAVLLAARLGLLPALRRGSRPFASASARIARLARREAGGEASLQAMLELHRAFDATAGKRVLAPDLDGFVSRHTQFAGVKQEITAFFAASQRAFFGVQQEQGAPPVDSLAALGRRLSRAERAA